MRIYHLFLLPFFCLTIHGTLPKNMTILPNLIEIDGCARLRDLVFPQVKVQGQIDVFNCWFDVLDASGFLLLVNSHIKKSMTCQGELNLRDSFCAKVCATTKLIVLENAHIDELMVEELAANNKRARPPRIILKGNSSVGTVTFTKMAGSIILRSANAQIGSVINGTIQQQSPEDQTE